jgi:hypothetical protein
MRRPDDDEREQGQQARLVATVMAGTMLLWMGAQWLGGQMGWESRLVFLFDLIALAAFAWALLVTWRLWRSRGGN